MKSHFLKSIYILTLAAGTLTGCVNGDDYGSEPIECIEPALTANKTVQDIISGATATPTLYTADDIIEAYVTSNDERGNFYKSVSFQTLDGSAGFSIAIDETSLFARRFIPGNKVYIKLKDLYVAIVDGSLKIGSDYQGEVGRIAEGDINKFLFPSCSQGVSEEDLVQHLTISQALSDVHLNKLIEFDNVQFADASLGRTYYDIDSGGGATNHTIVDAAGTSAILRISSFASFAGEMTTPLSGTIRGVLTKFGSTYQFMIRYKSDVKLTEPRIDIFPPIVGINSNIFNATLNENFESYTAGSATTGQNNFPKYINDPAIGSRYWRVRSASGNKYIEMSSFGTNPPPEVNRTLFIVPVDFTAANTLAFQTKASFYNGNTLKVYYSTDYVPGGDITAATLINITSNFAIHSGTGTSFLNSGTYNIPASLTGNGYFIFEYKGSGIAPLITTNMDIDNIVIN